MPPRQWSSAGTWGGGVSVAGKGSSAIPHALLPEKVLSITRSGRPPAIVMPVPTRPGAPPEVGVAPLLLLTSLLWIITQHTFVRCAPAGALGLVAPFGHSPSCGE